MLSFLINLYPYKLDFKKKEPIELNISIKNMDNRLKSVIINISLDNTLSFNSKALKSSLIQKINPLQNNEEKHFRFKIYPSKGMHPGKSVHSGIVKVYEYLLDSGELDNVYEKPIKINVF
ncbi:MAG TPA: hypothetical protein P5513_03915 [Candidatus Diapherotrites archaeon]|jgi:hypothetical protein|nr:hypothetical protein [Candidatus Diapherotrites archaeon]